jgi:hypothetical protein
MRTTDVIRWSRWRHALHRFDAAVRRARGGSRDGRLVPVDHIVSVAQHDADLIADRVGSEISMLSAAEISVMYTLLRVVAPPDGRVAELGTYLGGTTCVFGEALRRQGGKGRIEVYDFFEHNEASRRRLAAHPLYDPDDFFAIWEQNTAAYADMLEVHRGDLRQTATETAAPLWMLYVDIVKSGVLIGPVMQSLLPRLEVGGMLVHQDYYHWQSPWVVFATERVIDHFEVVGTVSNHTMILRLASKIPASVLEVDDASLPWDEKDRLFRRAILRFGGIRSALLRISRLNLMSAEGLALPAGEIEAIRNDFANAPRVQRYLDEVVRVDASGSRAMW